MLFRLFIDRVPLTLKGPLMILLLAGKRPFRLIKFGHKVRKFLTLLLLNVFPKLPLARLLHRFRRFPFLSQGVGNCLLTLVLKMLPKGGIQRKLLTTVGTLNDRFTHGRSLLPKPLH